MTVSILLSKNILKLNLFSVADQTLHAKRGFGVKTWPGSSEGLD